MENQNQPPSTPFIGDNYGQPAANPPQDPNNPGTIVINQQTPALILHPDLYKTNPVAVTCPVCRQTITTNVAKRFNCLTCLLCWCTCLVFYACIQSCRGKDICCYDATHTCPKCNSVVGTYNSC